ncbi:MAG: sugar ABC transporter permease [Oscillospiraceae bacterium]|jgi:putative aldouronate transport system permease protein|nr:sugar ABC transporter permease [Oscillospiraceae bacterium]
MAKEERTKRKRKWSRDDTELTLLGLPTYIWFICFSYLPMFGIIIAFKKLTFKQGHGFIYNLFTSEWCGLDNFQFLFKSSDAFIILRNTILYNVVFICLGLVIPVTLAILMSQLYNRKLAKICQTCMFLPHFMSYVVVSYFVWAFLSYDKGFVNNLLLSMGSDPKQWYMEPAYWPFLVVFINTWKGLGYGMVVYLATITGIDSTYYEAAIIDGATKWQQSRYITLPMLRPIIAIMFIMSIGGIFRSDFGLFYQVPRNSPSLYNVVTTLDVYIYNALGQSTNVGMASAAAFMQSALGCIFLLVANTVVKRIDSDAGLI